MMGQLTFRLHPDLEGAGRPCHGDDDVVQVGGARRGRVEGELLEQVRREQEHLGRAWTSQTHDLSHLQIKF